MTESVAPPERLARWLQLVVASAEALRSALAAVNKDFENFPRDEVDALAVQLADLPRMSVDGVLPALTYAGPKLEDLRQRWVDIADDRAALPDVSVGQDIDKALSQLIADINTARRWYAEAAQKSAEDSRIDEKLAMPGGSPQLAQLADRASKLADEANRIAAELRTAALPDSIPAEDLNRRLWDAQILARLEAIELRAKQMRLRFLGLLNRAMKQWPKVARAAVKAVRVAIDFTKPFANRYHEYEKRVLDLAFEIGDGICDDIDALIDKYSPPRPPRSPDIFRDRLKDGTPGPEMIVIPAGDFTMGSPDSDTEARDNEKPQRRVTIPRAFALARAPVTFEDYDRFCAATNRGPPKDEGWGRGRRPVINVTWGDAKKFCDWLSRETGAVYRLPAEAEWEYACRAGTETRYWWGDEWDETKANNGSKTSEVGDYPPNPWGLCDTLGNVWEWCEDHYEGAVGKLPKNGSVYVAKKASKNFPRVARGGSWLGDPRFLRCAYRDGGFEAGFRNFFLGFRLARTL